MNNQSYSKIIAIELVLFVLSFTIAIIIGLLGFEFYRYTFVFSGMLLGSIATLGYIRIRKGVK